MSQQDAKWDVKGIMPQVLYKIRRILLKWHYNILNKDHSTYCYAMFN